MILCTKSATNERHMPACITRSMKFRPVMSIIENARPIMIITVNAAISSTSRRTRSMEGPTRCTQKAR